MRKKRILIVDDQSIYREPIAAALDASGYKTVCATDGLDAIEQMERSQLPFALVVLDYSMPRMNGLAFLERMRQFKAWSTIPVVMLTEMAEKQFVLKAMELGVRDYVVKAHFSLDELLKCVEKHLK